MLSGFIRLTIPQNNFEVSYFSSLFPTIRSRQEWQSLCSNSSNMGVIHVVIDNNGFSSRISRSSITDSEVAESAFLRVLETRCAHIHVVIGNIAFPYRIVLILRIQLVVGIHILVRSHNLVAHLAKLVHIVRKILGLLIRIMELHTQIDFLNFRNGTSREISLREAPRWVEATAIFRYHVCFGTLPHVQFAAFWHHIIGTGTHSKVLAALQYFRCCSIIREYRGRGT